jgi:hypothetical protein
MHGVRAAIPQTSPLAKAEFATIRERLIKIAERMIEHAARILPSSWARPNADRGTSIPRANRIAAARPLNTFKNAQPHALLRLGSI